MTWAFQRQLLYLGILATFFLSIGFLVSYPYFNKPPSCTDGKQNGAETGVDCGGECVQACIFEVDDLAVLWSRSFQVVPGRYNAVAYLENKNKNAAVSKINYSFRFADQDNIYIGKREGSTFVPTAGRFAVFEPAIEVGNATPVYTTFEFTEVPDWKQVDTEKVDQLRVLASEIVLVDETTSPHLSAKIKNHSLFYIPELTVAVVLYDKDGNALSASHTYIEELNSGETKEINFTWPEPIVGGVVAKEVIPMYDIFSVRLK